LLAVWTTDYPLSQDGPSHLYSGEITRHLLSGETAYVARYRFALTPNLAGLAYPLLSPVSTIKLLISLSLLLPFVGVLAMAASFGKDLSTHSYLAFFLANTWFVWMGFYGFAMATGLALLAASYFGQGIDRWRIRDVAILSFLAVLVMFMHPFASLLLTGTQVLILADRIASPTGRDRKRNRIGALAWVSCLVCGTASILSVALLRRAAPSGHSAPLIASSAREVVQAMLYFPIDAFEAVRLPYLDQRYLIGLQALFITCALMEDWRRRGVDLFRAPLLIGSAAAILARLVLSDAAGGGAYSSVRLSFVAWLLLLTYTWGAREHWWLTGVVRFVSVGMLAIALAAQIAVLRQVSHATSECLSALLASGGARGEKFLRVRYGMPSFQKRYDLHRSRVDPMAHVQGWLAVETGMMDLTNYESLGWHFPIQLRSDKYPPTLRHALNSLSEETDGGHYHQLSIALDELGVDLDRVIVLGEMGSDWASKGSQEGLFALLRRHGFQLTIEHGDPVFLRVFVKAQRANGSGRR